MNEARQSKIPRREARGDLPHVPSDLHRPQAISIISLQGDPAAVRQRLEDMAGGVLIDAHRDLAAGLDPGEGRVGSRSRATDRGRCPLPTASGQEQEG